ncbi:MAG TPA: SCO family protein [Alphaproteobacteria bacterium]
MFNWRQRVIAILLAILVGAGIGYVQIRTQKVVMQDQSSENKKESVPPLAGITLDAKFSLIDQNHKPVTEKSWPGQYLLVYFGFAHCPDVCPLGLSKIAEALNALPKATADRIQPLFITVDPARDTVKQMKDYVILFHPRLAGLTGSQEQVDATIKNFRVYAQKQIIPADQGGDDQNYMMNHSSFTYLVAPDGKVADVFAHETSAEDMATKLKAQIK